MRLKEVTVNYTNHNNCTKDTGQIETHGQSLEDEVTALVAGSLIKEIAEAQRQVKPSESLKCINWVWHTPRYILLLSTSIS